MKTKTLTVKSDHAYIVPLGDLHVGDKAFGKKSRRKLIGMIDWIKEHPNVYVFLNGDLLNTATRDSKTSPFEQDLDLQGQISQVVEYLLPIKDRIIGAVCGNHEQRIMNNSGYDPTTAVLMGLGLNLQETYFKHSAVVKVQVGKRNGRETGNVAYTLFFHHTTGGGKKIGSKLNRVDDMRHLLSNADVYCGSHNHALSTAVVATPEYNPFSNTVEVRKQFIVTCGGYLEWDESYAEALMLEPMELGSPRIKLSGKSKDVRVSLWGGEWE